MLNLIDANLKADYILSSSIAGKKDRIVAGTVYFFSGRLLFLIGIIDFLVLEILEREGIKFSGYVLLIILFLESYVINSTLNKYLVKYINSKKSEFKTQLQTSKGIYIVISLTLFLLVFSVFFAVGAFTFSGYLNN